MSQNARQLPLRSTDGGALDLQTAYDHNGNVVEILDKLRGDTYSRWMSYDDLDRLSAAGSCSFGGDCWHRFSYDSLDNIKTWSLGGVKDHRYYYDPSNRLTNIQNASGASVIGLGYDVQGNLENKNGQAYAFDYGNRLRRVLGKEIYRYDALGRRVLSVRDDWSTTNRLSVYNKAGQLIYTEAGSPKKALEHVYLGNSLLAIRETDWAGTPAVVRYQHTDALGSPVAVTDAAGAVVERTDWEPYGAAIGKPAYDGVGFTGHVMDGGSGLTYMQQRYYDPTLGRFLSVDPVTANNGTGANFNRYWYGNNNPYKFTDPDGQNGELFWTAPDQVTVTFNYVMTGVNPQFTSQQLNAQVAQNFSGNVTVNGVNVTVTAQAVQVANPVPGQVVKTVNTVPNTAGVTQSGRTETNAIGGNQITLGATGPDAATAVTGSHEVGHALGAGDQYAGGLGANNQTLQADVPGPANIMKDLSGANANSQTLGEVIRAPTNVSKCAQGVSAASGGC